MFAAIATFWRAFGELFQALEVVCRTTRKGADYCEILVDKEIAEAKGKADQLSE